MVGTQTGGSNAVTAGSDLLGNVRALLSAMGLEAAPAASSTTHEGSSAVVEAMPERYLTQLSGIIGGHLSKAGGPGRSRSLSLGSLSMTRLGGPKETAAQVATLDGVLRHTQAEALFAKRKVELAERATEPSFDYEAELSKLTSQYKQEVANYPQIPRTLADWQVLFVDAIGQIPDGCQSKEALKDLNKTIAEHMAQKAKKAIEEAKGFGAMISASSQAASSAIELAHKEKEQALAEEAKKLTEKERALQAELQRSEVMQEHLDAQGQEIEEKDQALAEKEARLEAELQKLEQKEAALAEKEKENAKLNGDLERLTNLTVKTGASALTVKEGHKDIQLDPAQLKEQLADFYGERAINILDKLLSALLLQLPDNLGLSDSPAAQPSGVMHAYKGPNGTVAPGERYRAIVLQAIKKLLDPAASLEDIVADLKANIQPSAKDTANKNIVDHLISMENRAVAEGKQNPFARGTIMKPAKPESDAKYCVHEFNRNKLIHMLLWANTITPGDEEGRLTELKNSFAEKAGQAAKQIRAQKKVGHKP